MGEGGMGLVLLVGAASGVAMAAFVPLLLVVLTPAARSRLVFWTFAFGIASFTWVYLSVQIRVVTGPGDIERTAFMLGNLAGAAPLALLGRREFRRGWWNWPLAALPLVAVLPFGTRMMAFRGRSEELLEATRERRLDEVVQLLRRGADPDCSDPGGCAIDIAVADRNWKIVEILVEHGATNVEHSVSDDVTTSPYKELKDLGKHDFAERLLANGPSPGP